MTAPQIETIHTGVDKAKIAASVALVVAGLSGFYLIGDQKPIWQWSALLLALLFALGVFLVSEPGRRLISFGKEAWKEVLKVVWPTHKEARQITLYVFAFVVVMALFLWLTDKTLEWVFYDLILGWKR